MMKTPIMFEFLVDAAREEQMLQELCKRKSMAGNQERPKKKAKFDLNLSPRQLDSCKNLTKPEKKRKSSVKQLPESVRRQIEEKGRSEGEEDVKMVMVIQKVLERSDVTRQQNRVTIPLLQMQNKFLSPEQEKELGEKIGARYFSLKVPIIEPSGKVEYVNLRRWNVGGCKSVSYVLNGDWKHVVEFNKLRENQEMQLWAFWIKGSLNLAFVLVPNEKEVDGPKPLATFDLNTMPKSDSDHELRDFDLNMMPELD